MLTTVSGLICRKAQLPEVIGQILVGILVGPSLLGVMHMSDSLSLFSDLGIIILMFLGGVGCDLQLLKKYSKAAVIIACMGVVFPVAVMGGACCLASSRFRLRSSAWCSPPRPCRFPWRC